MSRVLGLYGLTSLLTLGVPSSLWAQGTAAFNWNQYIDAASGGVRTYPRWKTDPTNASKVVLEKAVGTLMLPGGTRPGTKQWTATEVKLKVYAEGPVPGTWQTTPAAWYVATIGPMTQTASNNVYNDVTFVDTPIPQPITKFVKIKQEVEATITDGTTTTTLVASTTYSTAAP
jgi:hypothetical protein